MTYKLLILHTNGVITAVLLIPLIASAVQATLIAIDPAKDRAYRTANAGKIVTRRTYEEAVGLFEKRLVVTDPYGNTSHHPADSLLLTITKTLDLPDIVAHAVTGKYLVKNKKLVMNPDWQEPTITITREPSGRESQG